MIVINLIVAMCEARNTLEMNRIFLRVRSALVSLIMKKMLKYPVTNPSEFTEGKILNFVAIDANKFELGSLFIMWLFSNTFMIILTTGAIGYLAGLICLPVVVTLLLGSCFIYVMNKKWNKLKIEMMMFKDKKINLLKNVISNIRFVKLRGLENFFHTKVFKKRNFEIVN